jgi:hypothetical protein
MSHSEPVEFVPGQKVCNPARPEWGVGEVIRAIRTESGGASALRVSVQFPGGLRVVMVPPAQLGPPKAAATREKGWLDSLSKNTLDDRLRALPAEAVLVLGAFPEKLAALAPYYQYQDEPGSILRWACQQLDIADPLTIYTRDELHAAFDAFCARRDAHLRQLVAPLRRGDFETVRAGLARIAEPARSRMAAVISG